MKILEFVKKYQSILVLAAVGVAAVFILRSCDITDESSYWQGKYAGAKLELARVVAEKDAAIAEKNSEIAALDKRVQQLNADIGQKNGAIATAQGEFAKLQEAYKSITDCPKQVENLTAQVKSMMYMFNLQAEVGADKDKVIFALTDKYNAQVVITGAWEAKYMASESARVDADKVIDSLRGDLRKARLFGSLKTVGVVALGAVVVYSLVKK